MLLLDLTMPGASTSEAAACLREHCPTTKTVAPPAEQLALTARELQVLQLLVADD